MKRQKRTLAIGATVTAAAAAATLGGYVAALDAVEPYAESRECSDIGRNACPPEPLPRTDSRDPELGRPVIEANPTEQALPPLG